MSTLLLSRQDIERVIEMKDVVEAVENTFRGMGEGTVVNPTKAALDLGESAPWPPYEGFMNAMPAYVGWLDTAGLKWVGGFRDNAALGLPFITAMTLVIDPRTGRFLAVMDGALITSLRTGAQAAVPLKWLQAGPRIRIGLYGAGAQARTATRAIAELFEIARLTVYDVRRDAALQFARELASVVQGRIVVADLPEQAAESDAIVCVTTSREKFLREAWIRPGTTVLPLGSYQECEDAFLLATDKILVDHVEQCLHRGAPRRPRGGEDYRAARSRHHRRDGGRKEAGPHLTHGAHPLRSPRDRRHGHCRGDRRLSAGAGAGARAAVRVRVAPIPARRSGPDPIVWTSRTTAMPGRSPR